LTEPASLNSVRDNMVSYVKAKGLGRGLIRAWQLAENLNWEYIEVPADFVEQELDGAHRPELGQ
jgi:hypothetical protein